MVWTLAIDDLGKMFSAQGRFPSQRFAMDADPEVVLNGGQFKRWCEERVRSMSSRPQAMTRCGAGCSGAGTR